MLELALNQSSGPVPHEAVEFLEKKGLQPGFSYLDVWAEEHHRAFTAAKFMREDVLHAAHEEVTRALRDGVPFQQFRTDVRQRFARMGWWGRQLVQDPDSRQFATVDVPSRLHRIYDTNMRTARAAGQWKRIERTKDTHPYLLYQLGPSKEHRAEHMEWHGLLLPADDPWWKEHLPPNGWGCKCYVRQVSRREAARLERDGIQAPDARPILDAQGLPTGHRESRRVKVRTERPKVVYVDFTNKRTGVVESVPRGVDPGFHRPPTEIPRAPGEPATAHGREIGVRPADAVSFHQAFNNAMQGNPRRAFVTQYTVEELAAMKALMIDATGRAGVAVKDHGDGRIEGTALFNNGGPPRAGTTLLTEAALQHGVNYLECYSYGPNDGLERLYASLGFRTETRTPFADEYASSDWDYARHGRPDYVTMRRRTGAEDE
jgi:hypothetical protein